MRVRFFYKFWIEFNFLEAVLANAAIYWAIDIIRLIRVTHQRCGMQLIYRKAFEGAAPPSGPVVIYDGLCSGFKCPHKHEQFNGVAIIKGFPLHLPGTPVYLLEPPCGVEPQTWALRMPCSTSWATVARALLRFVYCGLKLLIALGFSMDALHSARPPRGSSLTHYCVYDSKSSNKFTWSPRRPDPSPG